MTGYNHFLFAYSCFDVKKSLIVMITGIYKYIYIICMKLSPRKIKKGSTEEIDC